MTEFKILERPFCGHPEAKDGCEHCHRFDTDPAYRKAVIDLRIQGARKRAAKEKKQPVPTDGPGTELAKLLAEIGAADLGQGQPCAACKNWVDWMNRIGVKGFDYIPNRKAVIERLKSQAALVPTVAKLRAGFRAVLRGAPLTVEGLLDEAIRRATK